MVESIEEGIKVFKAFKIITTAPLSEMMWTGQLSNSYICSPQAISSKLIFPFQDAFDYHFKLTHLWNNIWVEKRESIRELWAVR